MSVKLSVAQYAARINQSAEKSVLAFIAQGKDCAEAEAKLTAEEKKELHSKLRMDKGAFSVCVAIGKCNFLEVYSASLPPAKSTLYLLTQMKEAEIKAGIAEGVVHPNVTREAVQAWVNAKKGKATVANDNQKLYRVNYPQDYTAEDKERFESDFREFVTSRRCSLGGSETHVAAEAEKARLDFYRANSRSVLKSEKLKGGAHGKRARQVRFKNDANAEDCRNALASVDRGAEWDRIVADADRLFGLLDKPQSTAPKKAPVRKKAA